MFPLSDFCFLNLFLNFLFTNNFNVEMNSMFMWVLKDKLQAFFTGMNTFRVVILAIPSVATILGILKGRIFLLGFGIGFLISSLMVATIAIKYG